MLDRSRSTTFAPISIPPPIDRSRSVTNAPIIIPRMCGCACHEIDGAKHDFKCCPWTGHKRPVF